MRAWCVLSWSVESIQISFFLILLQGSRLEQREKALIENVGTVVVADDHTTNPSENRTTIRALQWKNPMTLPVLLIY